LPTCCCCLLVCACLFLFRLRGCGNANRTASLNSSIAIGMKSCQLITVSQFVIVTESPEASKPREKKSLFRPSVSRRVWRATNQKTNKIQYYLYKYTSLWGVSDQSSCLAPIIFLSLLYSSLLPPTPNPPPPFHLVFGQGNKRERLKKNRAKMSAILIRLLITWNSLNSMGLIYYYDSRRRRGRWTLFSVEKKWLRQN
jgi:hypothetical protein